MVLEINVKQKNINLDSTITVPVNTVDTTVNTPVIQCENLGDNVDVVNTTSTQTLEMKTIRSEGIVREKLEDTAKKFNLSLDEVIDLIKKMTNKSFEDLLKLEQNEYNKLTIGLDNILASCLVDNKLDNTKLEKAINDYSIATQTGWTLEGFRKQQLNVKKSTIIERLAETGCFDKETIKPIIKEILNGRDINTLSKNELKEIKKQAIEKYLSRFTTEEYNKTMETAIEKFFEKELLSRIDKNTPQAEREKIYKAQLQTFGRLLVNTENGRDRELLGSAIDKLYRTNILPAARAGIQAMETEEAIANFVGHIDFEEAVTTDSQYEVGVYMTAKDAEDLAHLKFGNMNADDIKAELPIMEEKANEFFEKYNDKLAEIDEKLKDLENNPDLEPKDILSEEEFEIFIKRENYFKAGYSGATTGIATSNNSTVVEQRDELLQTITNDIYEIGQKAGNNFYTEVMEQIAEYVKNNQENLNITEAEFAQLMDKATEHLGDAKYSNVVETPNNENYTEDRTNQALGFERKDTPNVSTKTSVNNLYQNAEKPDQNKNNESKDETVITSASKIKDYFNKYGSIKGFKEYQKEHGFLAAITETLNNAKDTGALTSATESFKRRDCSQQINIIKGLFSEGLNIALNNAKQGTMERLENITLNTFAATKQAKKAVEEKLNA